MPSLGELEDFILRVSDSTHVLNRTLRAHLQARIKDETQDLELLDSLLGHVGVFSIAKECELSTLPFDPNCELMIL
jgi:hypothetical protein